MMEKSTQDQSQKKSDPFKKIKYVGYSLAHLPEGEITLADFVKYAKFQLAVKNRVLLKDPIWDEYTQEEILVEYFAHKFEASESFANDFKRTIGGSTSADSFNDWATKEIEKEQTLRSKTLENLEEKISFDPSKDILGDD